MQSALRTSKERVIHALLVLCALVSIATTLGIISVLIAESWPFFSAVSPLQFLTGTRWAPLLEPRSYGVLPLISGTVLIAGGALLVAVPSACVPRFF
jgi:phosphate transport system permease protein